MYYLQNIEKMTRWYTAYDFCIATCFSYLMALYWSHDYSICACCFNLQVNLRLILVSGKTKEFLFYPNDSVADVTDFVYRNWPRGNIKPFFPRCNLFKRRCNYGKCVMWLKHHPFPHLINPLLPCKKKKSKQKKQTYRSTNIKPFIKHSIKTNNIAMGFQLTFCHFSIFIPKLARACCKFLICFWKFRK